MVSATTVMATARVSDRAHAGIRHPLDDVDARRERRPHRGDRREDRQVAVPEEPHGARVLHDRRVVAEK